MEEPVDLRPHSGTLMGSMMKPFPSMVVCLGMAISTAAAAPEYYPRDLGTLGGTQSVAMGVNDLSQVVGWSLDAAGRTQAFVWAGGTLTGLGFLPGGTSSVATAINNSGDVTGYAYYSDTNYHAFLYASNVLQDLGTFGGPLSSGTALNDVGEITGWSYTAPEEFTNGLWLATFWWRTNTLLKIPPFRGFKRSCEGYGINDSGTICGTTFLYSPNGHNWAYVWRDTNSNSVADEGEMTPLGSLGVYASNGDYSEAKGINNHGQIVGWSGVSNNWSPKHAFLVTPSNGTWKLPNDTWENGYLDSTNFLMRDLGTLDRPIDNSFASAINDRAWIVGTSSTSSGTNQAFLWHDGVMSNLNDLIATETGWVLTNATGINEYNEIVGSGLYNGQPRAFILQAASALSVLGTNGAPIADSEPPSLAKGSDFGGVALETTATNVFGIRNLGSSNLTISAWTTNGSDAAHFRIEGIPAVIEVGGISNFTVAFASPAEGTYAASLSFESDAAVPVTNVLFAATGVRHPQTIDFPPIADQWATNEVELSAVASSGLAVEFAVDSGPAQIADLTNLTFTGAGAVAIVASQPGDAYWAPAPPVTNVFTVSKVPATVVLDDLAQTYDGTARIVSATTDPAGLAVEITYDGLAWAPTNAGTYAVTGTIAEALWEGWTNDVLIVAPADQAIDFPAIPDQWITNTVNLAATADSGLAVEFAIESGPTELADFTNLTFTGTGWVTIVASQPGDDNWNPAPPVTNAFRVSKMPAAAFLHDLFQTYDGTARMVSATTEPEGLAVEITYDGLAWAPTNAGTYAVTGTIAEANWEGWTNGALVVAPADQTIDFPAIPDQWITNEVELVATADSGFAVAFAVESGPAQLADLTNLTFTGTGWVAVVATQAGDANWNAAPPVTNVFMVSKMPASVFLGDLAQTYDGTARTVSATTDPAGLAVEITYDGLAWAPTNAGIYAVTGAIAEANWEGWTNGVLIVAPADQTIDFPAIPDQFITNVLSLAATADSGLPVEFALAYGPATFADPTTLTFANTGAVAVVATQPGDANWNPAPAVTNVFSTWGLYVLTVVTAHGDADPPAGIYTNLLATVLTNSVSVPEPVGGTQFVCTGWALTGHEPAAGTVTNFTMVVTNNATLAWRWTTNYWLETSAAPHGSVAPDSSWQPALLPAVLIATPDRYYHFDHWTNSASGTNNPFALIMDRPKSAMPVFAENLAIHDVPEWWLAEHGWTNDFDAAALADDEPDGFPTWQEFVADTIPTNALSYPRIAFIAAESTNAPVVTWLASTGRAYQVHFSDDFPGGTWATQQLPIGTGEWADTNPPLPPWRVYRLAPLRP
jgi:probable HAF family extracellular repeat protein